MKSLLFPISMILVLSGCTFRENQKSVVRFKLPEKRMSAPIQSTVKSTAKSAAALPAVGLWGAAPASSIAEIDCYGITLQAAGLAEGQCLTPESEALLVSELHGQYAAGSEVALDVPAGSARTFGVIGYRAVNGICADQMSAGFNPAQYSAPVFVGKVTADIDKKEVSVTIPVSMTDSKVIEKCEGRAYGVWPRTPACTPTLASATYLGNGDLQLNGSCLDQTQSLAIKEVAGNVTTNTTVVSKTPTQLVVKLLTNLVIQRSKSYQMLLTDARAQTATSTVSLQVNDDFVVKSNGTLLGTYISGKIVGGKPEGGPMSAPIGVEIGGKPVVWGTNGNGLVSLITGIYIVDEGFETLGYSDLRKIGYSIFNNSSVHFTGPNCDGDAIIPVTGSFSKVHVKYIVAPENCPGSCADQYYKVTGPMHYEEDVDVESYSQYYGNNSNPTLTECFSASATHPKAYRIPPTSMTKITPGSGGEAPATVSGLTVERP